MTEKKPYYTLPEIADWDEKQKVSLPTVQRGFVWTPSQIENLWDSLLRGYPIGAFVMSPKEDGSFEMLDGQQRATAICLGFGRDTFRDSQDYIKVFIDLERPGTEDNRKFIFRVITKSHPWGYQRTDNAKTLSSENKRHAMNMYEADDFLEPDLSKFFPYDASVSIPFYFFLNAALNNETEKQLLAQIQNWTLWLKVKKEWFKWRKENRSLSDYDESNELSTDLKIEKRISEILVLVKKMIDIDFGQKVPALYLDFDRFKKQVKDDTRHNNGSRPVFSDDSKEPDEENEATDEIENLFIRLNAGGTPLRGEELNYSILKAHISPELQDKIEKACEGFSQPARFITIAYRLFQQQRKLEQRDGLSMKIKPKQFQRTINEYSELFEQFITRVLNNRNYSGKTLINYTKHFLEFDEVINPHGLPHLISSKLADTAPEIMLMLLCRLLISGDQFEMNSRLQRKAIGMITIFMWLGKRENQRDHSKLLSNIWPCVRLLKQEQFWSSATVQRALLGDVLIPIPFFEKKNNKRNLIKFQKYIPQRNSDLFSKFDKDTGQRGYLLFADKMFYNRDLILYSQRGFLAKIFRQKQFHLDDTNMPFDWDHLSPNKLVYKKFGIPSIIKDWYNSIGNLRAWPYSLNRTDQDVIPAKKLNPLKTNLWGEDEKQSFELSKEKWNEFILKNPNLITGDVQLKDRLLQWSFCSEKWAECTVDNLKKDWKEVYKLINERTISLCKEWYTGLCIEDLIPVKRGNVSSIFKRIVHGKKWDFNPSHDYELKTEFRTEEDDFWVSKPIMTANTKLYLYISHSKDPDVFLQQDKIWFGVYEKYPGTFIKSIKIPEKKSAVYISDNKSWIQGYFTLVSFEEDAVFELIKDFKIWLEHFPNSGIRELTDTFIDSLAVCYKSKLITN